MFLNRFRKPDDMNFIDYIRYMRDSSDEELMQKSFAYEEKIPLLLSQYDPRLLYSEIEKMKWKDVKFKLKQIERRINAQTEALSNVIEQQMNQQQTPTATIPILGKYSNTIIDMEKYR